MKVKTENFLRNEVLQSERNFFFYSQIANIVIYILVTILLNSIRETASLWLIWPLIAIQLLFYLFIFLRNYERANICGFNSTVSAIVFGGLIVFGRVSDLEVIIIPLMTMVVMFYSNKTKNLPLNKKHLFKQNE